MPETEEGKTYGILKDGSRFPVPDTMSVMEALLTPKSWKSPATLIWILSWMLVYFTGVLYYYNVLPLWFFCVQFVFWRLAYNIGIGYMLYTQSNGERFLAKYKELMQTYPSLRKFLEASVVFEDNTEYRLDKFPDEFNAWMLFRQIENVILANDLVSYMVLSLVCWKKMSFCLTDISCFIIGASSIIFALWSKSDAHRVIGDFAWYWGDFFFLLDQNLTFDGIFQMFPHPMYTVGYAFMYGVPIMAKSYTLFYISVFGHLCQIAFLAFVENPHIDRTYNTVSALSDDEKHKQEVLYSPAENGESYLEPNELVVFLHFNIFRASDLLLALVSFYLVATLFFPLPPWMYALHYVAWRVFHHVFLGFILKGESESQWFSKHYPNPRRAFNNWKRIYNASVTITNLSFLLCVVKFFRWNVPFFEGADVRIFFMVVGALLVSINIYVGLDVYDVLGDFGYFYGDFFIRDMKPSLTYSGVYRYVNNPDTTLGMSAFYGFALISGSYEILILAILSHVAVKIFEALVEKPHMNKIHGSDVRKMGGLRSEVKRRVVESESVKKIKGKLDKLKKEN